MTNFEPVARDKREYLLAELRAAALRARVRQADIDAVGLALSIIVAETPDEEPIITAAADSLRSIDMSVALEELAVIA